MMKKNEKRCLLLGSVFLAMFVLWTALIQMVDVQSVGQNETSIGFATFNCWFHHLIGVNKVIYTITDWMGIGNSGQQQAHQKNSGSHMTRY